jgi:membrane protease YdiL (CAAX protease family)
MRCLLKKLIFWKLAPQWYLLALFLAPALMLLAAWLHQSIFHQEIDLPSVTFRMIALVFGWMIVRGGPGNEELGWRGFLLPGLLKQFNPFCASLVLTPIWAAWHIPLWFLPGLPHRYWPFYDFVLIVIPITFLFTLLHLRSRGSVLIAMLFHASINTGIHFLPFLPPRFPNLGPFAIWIALTWATASLMVWHYRKLFFAE